MSYNNILSYIWKTFYPVSVFIKLPFHLCPGATAAHHLHNGGHDILYVPHHFMHAHTRSNWPQCLSSLLSQITCNKTGSKLISSCFFCETNKLVSDDGTKLNQDCVMNKCVGVNKTLLRQTLLLTTLLGWRKMDGVWCRSFYFFIVYLSLSFSPSNNYMNNLQFLLLIVTSPELYSTLCWCKQKKAIKT